MPLPSHLDSPLGELAYGPVSLSCRHCQLPQLSITHWRQYAL